MGTPPASKSPRDIWFELIVFQTNIARRWLKRGKQAQDVFAKFFFYFSGFNALYFLLRKIDQLKDTNEKLHISNLLARIEEKKASHILNEVRESVEYFCERRPIQRMDKRSLGHQSHGEEKEGSEEQEILRNNQLSARDRLAALGRMLYLIRSNLVHGSKAESGDDEEVIEKSVEPLRLLLEESLKLADEEFGLGAVQCSSTLLTDRT